MSVFDYICMFDNVNKNWTMELYKWNVLKMLTQVRFCVPMHVSTEKVEQALGRVFCACG